MRLLAIDPGSTHSAYVITDETLRPRVFDKLPNEQLLLLCNSAVDQVAIEQIGHYGTGMPAGQTIFDTCVWIGRFYQTILDHNGNHAPIHLIMRREVKLHLCGSSKANDGNVVQALIDRFAPGERNHGKGIKNVPGWFYGFHADIWQAYALAVYYMDTHREKAA
jgi:hypothetical protein